MELSFKDSDFVNWLRLRQEEMAKKPAEFVFDDEPLERILYGENQDGPSPASLYLPALPYIEEIHHALSNGEIEDATEQTFELREKGYPISKAMCFEIATIMQDIVPDYPYPVMKLDLSGLGPLADMMWDMTRQSRDPVLEYAVGRPLYHWYEHHQRFEEARDVLKKLIRICHDRNKRADEALFINNFAFEYLLEAKFKEAMPFFRKAADIFQEEGENIEHANAYSNYLECRFGCSELERLEEIEGEVISLISVLEKGEGRKVRKPLILLARIEEQKGNIQKAIGLVEHAINACENSQTRYPEMDRGYLEQLKSQMR